MKREQLIQNLLETMGNVFRGMASCIRIPNDAHNLNRPQIHILFAVSKAKDGLNVKDLAATLNVTSAAITQFTDDLVTKDLIARKEDPKDRRSIRLFLSEKTRQSFQKFRQRYFAHLQPVFNNFSDGELEQFIHLLQKIEINNKEEESRNENGNTG